MGGFETLDKMEKIATDEKDRPKEPISILKVTIFVDPFQEALDFMEDQRRKMEKKTSSTQPEENQSHENKYRSGVGSFVDLKGIHQTSGSSSTDHSSGSSSVKRDHKTGFKFGNFNNW